MNQHLPNLAPDSAPFSGFPASGFFYSNLHIQETFTTIRYGIKWRNGLAVLSGEAGIGKSTLLHKITADLGPNVICITATDPRLNFADILRLILSSLDALNESESASENAMLRSCKFQLRACLERGQIVALIFDNAHHLTDSTLRQLAQNFLDDGPTDGSLPLLQIVLAGRPQLKDKLLQAARLSGQEKLPILCELHPLENFEIASYVEEGLRASALPMDLFEPRAIKRIIEYGRGNPSSINAVCDRALQISGGDTVTFELIESVANDFEVRRAEHGGSGSGGTSFVESAENLEPPQFQLGETNTTQVVGETFLRYNRGYERDPWFGSRRGGIGWVQVLVILILVAGTDAWLRTDSGKSLIFSGREMLSAILQTRRQGATESSAVPAEPMPPFGATDTEPNQAAATDPEENQVASVPLNGPSEASTDSPGSAVAETLASPEADPLPKPNPEPTQPHRPPARHNEPQHRENLQAQVMQAIENRAIMGVAVSVVEGTAFLDGRVATERQRRAAERAARSVTGVERVRNRIAVSMG
ncbi:MAG: AAA family ATPase [Chloroflexota bacterium]